MSRSSKRSITVPNPVRDAIKSHLSDGTLDYPSENAAWVGLARYHLICGQGHPLTEPIARMHADDQDIIDDFLSWCAENGHNLKGRLLDNIVRRVQAGKPGMDISGEKMNTLLPDELLKMAKRWKNGEVILF